MVLVIGRAIVEITWTGRVKALVGMPGESRRSRTERQVEREREHPMLD